MSKWQKFNLIISNLVFLGLFILLSSIFYDWVYSNYIREPYRPVQLAEEKTLIEAAEKKVRIQWVTVDNPIKFKQGVSVDIYPIGVSVEVEVSDGYSYGSAFSVRKERLFGYYGKSYSFRNLVNLTLLYPDENKPWVLFDCRVQLGKLNSFIVDVPSILLTIERADNCSDKRIKKNSMVLINLIDKSFRVYEPISNDLKGLNLDNQTTFVRVDENEEVEFPLLKKPNLLNYNLTFLAHKVGEGKNRKEVFVSRPYELDLVTGEWKEMIPPETLVNLQKIIEGQPNSNKQQ